MTDRNVTDAAQHFDAQEAAAEGACARAAAAHGLTAEQAEQCDDGDQGCPTCPWRKAAPGVGASEVERLRAEQAAAPTAAYGKTYGTEKHMQLPPGYEVWATDVQPSEEPGAWTCKACGFRGFWRGGAHCGPSGVTAARHFPASDKELHDALVEWFQQSDGITVGIPSELVNALVERLAPGVSVPDHQTFRN